MAIELRPVLVGEVDGLTVLIDQANGEARVRSRSKPAEWHIVTPDGDCDCVAYSYRRSCSHVKAISKAIAAQRATEPAEAAPDCRCGAPALRNQHTGEWYDRCRTCLAEDARKAMDDLFGDRG